MEIVIILPKSVSNSVGGVDGGDNGGGGDCCDDGGCGCCGGGGGSDGHSGSSGDCGVDSISALRIDTTKTINPTITNPTTNNNNSTTTNPNVAYILHQIFPNLISSENMLYFVLAISL